MRVKRGVPGHAKHVKIRKATRGFSHPNRVSVKRGRQTLVKSMQFATRDRKNRKRTFRELWIARINAAAHMNGTSYNKLISGLKAADITLDRKVLAELAVNDPAAFTAVVEAVNKK